MHRVYYTQIYTRYRQYTGPRYTCRPIKVLPIHRSLHKIYTVVFTQGLYYTHQIYLHRSIYGYKAIHAYTQDLDYIKVQFYTVRFTVEHRSIHRCIQAIHWLYLHRVYTGYTKHTQAYVDYTGYTRYAFHMAKWYTGICVETSQAIHAHG